LKYLGDFLGRIDAEASPLFRAAKQWGVHSDTNIWLI